jgi:hypothetical protein
VRPQQASPKACVERKPRRVKRELLGCPRNQGRRRPVLPASGLAGSEVAASKILQQLADTNSNEQQRPIVPEELENIDVSEVLDQEHRPNGD